MTAAFWSSRYWMVGRAARMRLSSVMTPLPSLARGTLKSQRSKDLLALNVHIPDGLLLYGS